MAKRTDPKADRKQKLEELKRQQRAKERRKTLITVGIASVLGLALIGAVTVPAVLKSRRVANEKKAAQREAKKPLADFGVKADAAGCSAEVVANPIPAGSDHVPQGQTVDYPESPPNGGKHADITVGVNDGFYERSDQPSIESAVHDLEHGVVIGWYDKTLPDPQVRELRKIGAAALDKNQRFIAIPWDRANFPESKPFVLTSWGHTQRCSQVSGEVINTFVTKNQNSEDAPERGAQV